MDPASEAYLHDHLQEVVQAAIDSTTQVYREHGIDDVEDRLRSELSDRGVDINDHAWLNEAAGMIRAGLPVVVADSEDPDHGSGGSSGGHRGTQTRQQPGNDRSTE
jgi:hypothetical protein